MDKSNGRRLKDSTGLIPTVVNYSLFVHKHRACKSHSQYCGKNTREKREKTKWKLYQNSMQTSISFPFFAANNTST